VVMGKTLGPDASKSFTPPLIRLTDAHALA
jgi:hypothetical protein